MKRTQKWLCLFLALSLLLPVLIACKQQPAPSEVTVDLSEYTVVRSADSTSSMIRATNLFVNALGEELGCKFSPEDDQENDGFEKKEILLGHTSRDESDQALEALSEQFSYSIQVIGEKICLIGATPELTQRAMDSFLELCGAEEADGTTVTLPTSLLSDPLAYRELITDGRSNYKLIYGKDTVNTPVFDAFKGFMDSFNHFTTLSTDFGDDWIREGEEHDLSMKAIVLGSTSYPRSAELLQEGNFLSWSIADDDNQIYVAAEGTQALSAACESLIRRMENGKMYSDEKTVRLCRSDEPWEGSLIPEKQKIPTYEGGTLSSTKEFSDGFYRYYYTNTNKSLYDAYLDKLEAHGYALYAKNVADKNEYHTFYKEDQMIHTYYLAADKTTRVISASASDAIPYPKEPVADKAVTTPALAMADMDYENQISGYNRGMGFVYTLADGSYVIIDGGYGTEAEPLYRYLEENNCREDGKIRIRAWILTHPDGDHYECFLKFAKLYADRVILDYWVAQVSTELIFNTHMDSIDALFEPDDPDRPILKPGEKSKIFDGAPIVRALDQAINQFEGVVRIVPMTGQTMYFGDLKMQFVYTGEMLYPKEVSRGATTNEHSLVMRIWFQERVFLITGDVLHNGMKVMVSNYTAALQADFIQAPHHGLQGTMEFYNKSDARYLIMCTDEASCADRFMEDFNKRKSKNDLYALTTKVKENGEKQIEYVFLADNSENGFIPMMLGSEIIFSDMK